MISMLIWSELRGYHVHVIGHSDGVGCFLEDTQYIIVVTGSFTMDG